MPPPLLGVTFVIRINSGVRRDRATVRELQGSPMAPGL